MARKAQDIRVSSYVRMGGQLVNTEDLGVERRRKLATWLTCTYLNAIYEEKARFYPAEQGRKETG